MIPANNYAAQVVDELDRLLRQDYQGWLPKVLSAAQPVSVHTTPASMSVAARRIVKVVVSATLTRDPAKVGRLELQAPRFVSSLSFQQDHNRYRTTSVFVFSRCIGCFSPNETFIFIIHTSLYMIKVSHKESNYF